MGAGGGGAARRRDGHDAVRGAAGIDREAAQKIGFLPDIGTVETGKLADLVVFDADPFADIHNSVKIRWVIKNGELFDAADADAAMAVGAPAAEDVLAGGAMSDSTRILYGIDLGESQLRREIAARDSGTR